MKSSRKLFSRGVAWLLCGATVTGFATVVPKNSEGSRIEDLTLVDEHSQRLVRALTIGLTATAEGSNEDFGSVNTITQNTMVSSSSVNTITQNTIVSSSSVNTITQNTIVSSSSVNTITQNTIVSSSSVNMVTQNTIISGGQNDPESMIEEFLPSRAELPKPKISADLMLDDA